MTILAPAPPLTFEEFWSLAERGAFGDQRVELVGGEIKLGMPLGRRHGSLLFQVYEALSRLLRPGERRYGGTTVRLSPVDAREPDLVIAATKGPDDRSALRPEDVRLSIEIADATLAQDLTIKRDAYAAAGIPEYWVIAAEEDEVHVFRDPQDGVYRVAETHRRGDRIQTPRGEVAVDDLLGPA